VAGQQYVVDDFSIIKVRLLQYETACNIQNGKYVQLSYEAICTQSQASETKNVWMVVSQQPKCYSKQCTPSDDEQLFQLDALESTQAHAEKEIGGQWRTCQGAVKKDGISACEMQTLHINSQAGGFVIKLATDFQPEITKKKFLLLVDMAEKSVDFTDSRKLEDVCFANGGILYFYNHLRDTKTNIMCSPADPGEGGSDFPFEVQGLSAYLGTSCAQSGSQYIAEAMVLGFKEKMLQIDELGESGESMVCTLTSASTMRQAAVLNIVRVMSVSLFWCLFY
jgi:hypothetical protein